MRKRTSQPLMGINNQIEGEIKQIEKDSQPLMGINNQLNRTDIPGQVLLTTPHGDK